ncbi:MAG: biosynthetic-type acetolactate synthase large subunit [Acidaminobacteraceae bacterium]
MSSIAKTSYKISGARAAIDALYENNVTKVFGYPGGAVLNLYDELYKFDKDMTHIRTAHEQNAVHAADGFARSTGQIGAVIVTSGPGASNTITGIATAYMDSVPMIIISGQVAREQLGKDSFQELDITGITMSITKANIKVKDIKMVKKSIYEAIEIALTGRMGPVLVDIPSNIFNSEIDESEFEKFISNISLDSIAIDESEIDKVMRLIDESKRPIFLAGGGIIKANLSEEFRKLAQATMIPVATTLMGLGSVDSNSKTFIGMCGMHGSVTANKALLNADLVISIGSRFSDRTIGNGSGLNDNQRIIHIDSDKSEINKNIESYLDVSGELKNIVNQIASRMNPTKERYSSHTAPLREKYEIEKKASKNPIDPFIKVINKEYEDAFIITDVGQHQMWTAQSYKFKKPRQFVTSGGLGTMGFGIGAAIGTQIGNSGSQSILFIGDGGFRMSFNEAVTIKERDLNIKIFMIRNNTLGMVRQWQSLFKDRRFSSTDIADSIDYKMLINSFGVKHYEINTVEDLEKALEEDKSENNRQSFYEIKISSDEYVMPMIPPGKGLKELIEKA